MDIRPALSVLKSAIDLSETVAALTRSAPQPELRSAVRALEQALAELKSHCLALQDDLAELAERLAAYDQITLEHGLYWRFIGDKKIAGPFCPKCYEEKQELLKLRYHPGGIGKHARAAYYECEVCGSRFEP